MTRHLKIDWPSVEVDFRAGQTSIREIARKHGIADSNLRARAKREGWSRDDGEAVRQATRSAVTAACKEKAQQIGAAIGEKQARQFGELLEEASLSAAQVALQHKAVLDRARRLSVRMLDDLILASEAAALIEAEIAACKPDDPARAALVDKLLGIRGRVEAFDKWMSSFAKLSAAEREAYQIGIADDSKETIDDLLMRIHRERLAPSH